MAIEETEYQRLGLVLSKDATNEDKLAFVKFLIDVYHQKPEWSTGILLQYFKDYFHPFAAADFRTFDADSRRIQRNILTSRGDYVPKGRNVLISDA